MVNRVFGQSDLPSGSIAHFDSGPSSVPSGWVICDGNNGTPNLLDKYTKSVPDSSTAAGSTGGENSKSITEPQLPAHDHSAGSTGTAGSHSHSIDKTSDVGGGVNDQFVNSGGGGSLSTGLSGSHSHQYSDSSAGSDNSFDNRPESYELVPVMKI